MPEQQRVVGENKEEMARLEKLIVDCMSEIERSLPNTWGKSLLLSHLQEAKELIPYCFGDVIPMSKPADAEVKTAIEKVLSDPSTQKALKYLEDR